MLPSKERLKNNSEFRKIYSKKRSAGNSLFVLYVQPKLHKSEELPKVGFVVGKKIHKRANRRNRVKRLMREAYKLARKDETLMVKKWRSMIFVARSTVLELNFQEVYDGIVDILRKSLKKYGK